MRLWVAWPILHQSFIKGEPHEATLFDFRRRSRGETGLLLLGMSPTRVRAMACKYQEQRSDRLADNIPQGQAFVPSQASIGGAMYDLDSGKVEFYK